MKASEVMKAVKEWYDLSNYDVLQEITLSELNKEAYARLRMHQHDFDGDDEGIEDLREMYVNFEKQILRGDVLLYSSTEPKKLEVRTDKAEYYPLRKARENPLENAKKYIKHITVQKLVGYEKDLLDLKLLTKASGPSSVIPSSSKIGDLRLTDIERLHPHKPLYLELNIRMLSDEEVIEHMKRMLPEWRRTHNIREPQTGSFRFGLGTIKKLINFRIIPMLDLMFWSKRNNAKISNEQLSRLLYPNDSDVIRGGSQIKDTDKPFAEKVLTREFERLFNLYLSKNDDMINTRVRDAMSIDSSDDD
jgi:hypothetical protein